MRSALAAGAAYFAVVFALGFVLGAARTLAIARGLDELVAVALELPLMLTASWLVCGRLIRRFALPPLVQPRVVMGGGAFALLMIAEALLATFGFGETFSAYAASFQSPPRALGLAGQVAFASLPLVQMKIGKA